MRLLYVDIDTLRADHLGCYGYHRATSPTIDGLAARGLRLDRCYASDTPCLPSRSALMSGRFGIRNGAISHGGAAADLFAEGRRRGFQTLLDMTSWTAGMRRAGLHTASISTFAERHSALHWHSGFNEVHNLGSRGLERADEVAPVAVDWLRRNARRDSWFLHVHLWDPHTPYRTPAEYGEPFASDPLPAWLTEEVRADHWTRPGPHSAQEFNGFHHDDDFYRGFPRQPESIASMAEVRRMFDGYDTGVRYADDHVARLLETLESEGILDETAILVSGDHGETLGELGIYGDHQTADELTARVPMVVHWPGVTTAGQVDGGLHYQVDVAATVLELLGVPVPEVWDGAGFAGALRRGEETGRPFLVLSQAAWCAQRSVRFDDWLYLRTHHDGYHGFADEMLFDVVEDPHEQVDLAGARPDVVMRAAALLEGWRAQALARSDQGDPMETVLAEGGPFHVRGELGPYLDRLRRTGRGAHAARLEAAHLAAAAR